MLFQKRSFFRKSLLTLCAACAMAGAARAQENYLPQTVVPWMEEHGLVLEAAAINEETGRTRPDAEKRAAKPPSIAVLTPADTRELLRNLRDGPETERIAPPSPLERSYAGRIIENLTQYGYETFGPQGSKASSARKKNAESETAAAGERRISMPAGADQDDFVLGTGDRVEVIFRGQIQKRNIYPVSSDGMLVVEDFAPISAAGRTIAQVRTQLESEVAEMHNTEVFVALDAVHQIDVLVVGHVAKPGQQTLTAFNTVIDALMQAGGIDKNGSLRQIKLVRDGRSAMIDLYGLLVHGSANMDLTLRDGDRLIIPTIGPTIAVAGSVKQPGIYEILPGLRGELQRPDLAGRNVSLEEALELSGGVLNPGQNRYIMLAPSSDGREHVKEITDAYDPVFGNGSILRVEPSKEVRAGTVELAGHTRKPGLHDLDETNSLSQLITNAQVFGPDIYPLIGVIERWDNGQLAHQMLPFPPLLVLKGQFDRKLEDGDIVHLFSHKQIMALQKDSDKIEAPKKKLKKDESDDVAEALIDAAQVEEGSFDELPDPATIQDPVMAGFLRERAVFVRGAVRQPGAWPVAEGATLDNVIAAAGGMTLEASTGNIEVTTALNGEDGQAHGRTGTRRLQVDYTKTEPSSVQVEPGDSVRVNQKFLKVADNSVLIIGEVAHPGRYDLIPGDKMSDLIERAGGMTPQAYPPGAIFSRESERKAEEGRFRATARDLEQSFAAAMQDKDKAPDANQIAMAKDLASQLREVEAVGRITVEADPNVLKVQPELDMLLESGDRVYVPRRPLTVKVSGEVLSPAALQFRSNKDAPDYIAQAGGFTYNADKDRVFVVYPDGSAQPLQVNAWNHLAVMIPPGSSIVVPRDPKPFNFIDTARDLSQILSNLAITGIFLDDIRSD